MHQRITTYAFAVGELQAVVVITEWSFPSLDIHDLVLDFSRYN